MNAFAAEVLNGVKQVDSGSSSVRVIQESANAKTRSCSISKIGKTKVSKSKTYYVSILTKKKVGKKTLRAKQLFYNQLYYTYKWK